ncbi:ras GTPase-activating protein-binding protein 2-like [Xenia sp. Carnegie-2017]|uniref:ras GTPase-activating protein-binding protein 2-like n=1 Tax=Xenia sp. Carnegie-2017 TaxID=2897299 RepID=UPI001F048A91|nr:ras GTPase-activating protein-binding protein 2-like [Xenia sp. Carnegie-2017]
MPVMANEKPSAEHVGREFVRQYYTMLNKDPRQVHRFYSKDSVFFHGGPGNLRCKNPVVGQEEIYEQIENLNFKDCHAKILQVDSQFTVSDSVVVQVCGEFSNNGEPTKKFVQTFVLVPEGSKKYHVRNDIFRYQEDGFPDEVSDETGDLANESEGDDEVIDERELDNKSEQFNNSVNVDSDQTSAVSVSYSPENEQKNGAMQNGTSDMHDEFGNDEKETNDETELEEVVVDNPFNVEESASAACNEESISDNHANDDAVYQPEEVPDFNDIQNTESPAADEDAVEQSIEETNEKGDAVELKQESSGPVSWAALASKTPKPGAQSTRSYEPKKQLVTTSVHSNPEHVSKSQPQRSGGVSRGNVGTNNSGSKDRFNGRNAPDNCQVFIGNLPYGLEEQKVYDAFSHFGKIVDVRLNPKNFGFVIFDSPEPAEQVLKHVPIQINGQDINIEEKKPSGSFGRGGRGGLPGNRGKPGASGRGGMNAREGKRATGGNAAAGGRGGTGGGQNNSTARARRDRR